jgi:hypothetical protein
MKKKRPASERADRRGTSRDRRAEQRRADRRIAPIKSGKSDRRQNERRGERG